MGTDLDTIKTLCVGGERERISRIYDLEEKLFELPQIEIPVKDYIHATMYYREITIPKGTLVTGDLYKFDHFDIMISGDITVTTQEGGPKRLKGYNVFKALAGKKRAAYAHEDTIWVNVHPFIAESGERVQEMVTANSLEELDEFYKGFKKFLEVEE